MIKSAVLPQLKTLCTVGDMENPSTESIDFLATSFFGTWGLFGPKKKAPKREIRSNFVPP